MRSRDGVPFGNLISKIDALAREQGELQAEQLVIGETTACGPRTVERRRIVDLAQGASKRHETMARNQIGRQEIAGIARISDRGGYDAAHPGGGDALPHGMDRQDARISRADLGTFELLDERRLHLAEALVEEHLARKRDRIALMELLVEPRLAEEGRGERARIVIDVDGHDVHARPRLPLGNLIDRAHHRHGAADLAEADLDRMREVEVAARDVQHEVADAQDPQALEGVSA